MRADQLVILPLALAVGRAEAVALADHQGQAARVALQQADQALELPVVVVPTTAGPLVRRLPTLDQLEAMAVVVLVLAPRALLMLLAVLRLQARERAAVVVVMVQQLR